MGSVSSLISGHSLHSKHCKASESKLKKGLHAKKTGRSLDGLLKYGFSPDHCATNNNNSKVSYHAGKNEDFFYIKVNNKPRTSHSLNAAEDSPTRTSEVDSEMDRAPPELVLQSGRLEKTVENALIRPTAFKPVLPRSSSSSMETHNNLSMILGKRISPTDRIKDLQDSKLDTNSGTFSDSGRNSMSSLPTQSTSGSSQMDNLSTSTGQMMHHGGYVQQADTSQTQIPQNDCGSGWICGRGNVSSGGGGPLPTNTRSIGVLSEALTCVSRDLTGAEWTTSSNDQVMDFPSSNQHLLEHRFTASEQSPTDMGGCVRSPISMDESLIQELEHKLLERETEMAELHMSLEERELDTCQLFEEKQRYCAEEMEGLKQRCSTKLRQVSQRALKAQQLLQLQVIQLQQDKEHLQEEVDKLIYDRDTAECRIKTYESQKNHLGPTLEETQWEVCQKSGEISLLKQQLRDSQSDAANKLSEIVGLKASLKESRSKMQELEKKNSDHEEALCRRSAELEVCKNEFQRKKNEAELLREKVTMLETDTRSMKQDLAVAKEEQQQLMAMRAKIEEQQLLLQISQNQREALEAGHAKTKEAHEAGPRGGSADLDRLQKEVERLRGELKEERQKKHKLMNCFQQEKQTWNKEKNKVIRYQKQLQYNYLQMYRKNKDLEKILRELTAEMDTKTEMDVDLNFDKVIATEI